MSTSKNKLLDVGSSVKQGEELDIKAVEKWLANAIANDPKLGEKPLGTAEVTQYAGGASNWTYRLKYQNRDLILRRPPKGTKAKSAHDMVREYNVQQTLYQQGLPVPKMIALCEDQSVIGCDFYIMERIEGIILRSNIPKELNFSHSEVAALCRNLIDTLVRVHQVEYKNTPLAKLGRGKGYCARQVNGWDKRYAQAKTINVPSFKLVRSWLKKNTPADIKTCLIHNDWRFDNVILDPQDKTKIIGILDWEMATLGDPLMDLGGALAYWVQADDNFIVRQMRRQPTHVPGMYSREQVVKYYLQQMQLDIDNWTFYDVFGLFRVAAILQQIYYRYYHKQTTNAAFKNFWILINVIHVLCLKRIAIYEGSKLKNKLWGK